MAATGGHMSDLRIRWSLGMRHSSFPAPSNIRSRLGSQFALRPLPTSALLVELESGWTL